MPLSIWLGMEAAVESLMALRPASVLDAGVGFGLWGHLARQYLDVWQGRVQPSQWRVRIDGIELVADRVLAHHQALYDEIRVGDVREEVPRLASERLYDLILFGDVLEHLPKEDALRLLRTAAVLAGRRVMVRIPLGDGWREQGRIPADDHRSWWSAADFDEVPRRMRIFDFHGNPYALVEVDSVATRRRRVEEVALRVERLEQALAAMVEGPAGGDR